MYFKFSFLTNHECGIKKQKMRDNDDMAAVLRCLLIISLKLKVCVGYFNEINGQIKDEHIYLVVEKLRGQTYVTYLPKV